MNDIENMKYVQAYVALKAAFAKDCCLNTTKWFAANFPELTYMELLAWVALNPFTKF